MKLELYETDKGEETPTSLKARWVAALRSGEYEQGRCRLRSHDDHYCCLGVLCAVVDNDKWIKTDESKGYYHSGGSTIGLAYAYLTGFVINTLMGMNDGQHKSFKEIADYIEANVNVTKRI